ncbi:MAG: family 20 glycosylhydrolase [Ignavibacteriae bacterium]|nr:family 20 glycosylhydrolase [Ignavibacteriota bacterium]
MPVPSQIQVDGKLAFVIDSSFAIKIVGRADAHVKSAVQSYGARLAKQTGIIMSSQLTNADTAKLVVQCNFKFGAPKLGEDESYSIEIDERSARISSKTYSGMIHALETFLQLVELGPNGFAVPKVTIRDAPRFPWRGLLIDACRHWMPVEVIKRNLDGMALVKMNVLHWHLSEDQGFRVETKKFPKLHELGSDGNYYTQGQIKDVIAYASERGIRVVPEFDMPGHTTSWFVGHPELASAPGPYQIERKWGVFHPSMDPTKESTYRFLDTFVGEMSRLFPEPYFHIGGDEVTGKQWDSSATIQKFMRKKGFKDNHALQAYFNRRVLAIVTKHKKRMVGWDEIFHPDLPKNIVVQSWRGQKSLAATSAQGYQGILSYGYYLDHIRTAAYHYSIDPIDSTIARLSEAERSRILGGEACMWAEYVVPENVDSRIWPRTAAIAERLWSQRTTSLPLPNGSSLDANNVQDMYRRMEITSRRLEFVGLTHRTGPQRMLERLANGKPLEPFRVLANVVEPVKFYERGRTRKYTSFTPMNRLVDAALPESDIARAFSQSTDNALRRQMLMKWRDNYEQLTPIIAGSPLLEELEPLSKDLADVSVVGLRIIDASESKSVLTETEKKSFKETLDRAEKSKGALQIAIIPALRNLLETVTK